MKVDYEKIFANGNFGKVVFGNKDEDFFVVVNDKIVYQNHGFDFIEEYRNDFLTTYTGSKIMVVVNNSICSYEHLISFLSGICKPFENPIVWERQNIEDRKEKKSTRATLTLFEIKEKLGVDELTIVCE